MKKGEHKKAIEKYSESLKHNPAEVTTYTNRWVSTPVWTPQPVLVCTHSCCVCVCTCRALCYLSVNQYRDAVRDCDEALMIDGCNIKALYRRAQAHREMKVRSFITAGQLGTQEDGSPSVSSVGPASGPEQPQREMREAYWQHFSPW